MMMKWQEIVFRVIWYNVAKIKMNSNKNHREKQQNKKSFWVTTAVAVGRWRCCVAFNLFPLTFERANGKRSSKWTNEEKNIQNTWSFFSSNLHQFIQFFFFKCKHFYRAMKLIMMLLPLLLLLEWWWWCSKCNKIIFRFHLTSQRCLSVNMSHQKYFGCIWQEN